jgi:MinD-like ATPase involved in chromosome partitioning or flagellar assembly
VIEVLVGLVSAKGSPGVTTAALALASRWPRTALLLDADPFGGDVRAGLGRGEWPPSAGLADVVVDLRTIGLDQALNRRVHRPAPHAPPVLAGLGCVGQAGNLPWPQLGPALARLAGADVVADCGRFAAADGVVPLLRVCDALVLVTGSSLRAVRAAARIAPLLQEDLGVGPDDPRVSVLVVAPNEPYSATEIAHGCRLPLLGDLPDDPQAAAVWSDGYAPCRAFPRRPLQREAQRIAARLAGLRQGRGAA